MTKRAAKLHRYRGRCPFWAIADAPVWYEPTPHASFPAVIERVWFADGSASWVARLRDVRMATGATTVASVLVSELRPRIEPAGRRPR